MKAGMVLGSPSLLVPNLVCSPGYFFLQTFQGKGDWFIRDHTTVVEAAPWWPLPSGGKELTQWGQNAVWMPEGAREAAGKRKGSNKAVSR